MKKSRGLFIVLEGLDGSGTTTQAKMLHRYFTSTSTASFFTCEPTDEPVGKLIRDALSGRLFSPGRNEKVAFSEKALCLLFAADRLEHSRAIEEIQKKRQHVVCDRYILSSLAYQTLESTIQPQWVICVNKGCAVPDLTVFLNVPAEECARRIRGRKNRPTIYERKEKLRAIEKNYEKMRRYYEKHFGPVITIDGVGAEKEVHARVLDAIAARVGSTPRR